MGRLRTSVIAGVLLIATFATSSSFADVPFTEINRRAEKATVYLSVTYFDKNTGQTKITQGTGFIVSQEGLIVTAAHVLRDWSDQGPQQKSSEQIIANIGGRNRLPDYHVELVHRDSSTDLATLRMRTPGPYNPVAVCFRNNIEPATRLYAYGFPLGGDWQPKEVGYGNDHAVDGRWEVSGDLDHGMSGGPVFDKTGVVVAVVAGGITPTTKPGFPG